VHEDCDSHRARRVQQPRSFIIRYAGDIHDNAARSIGEPAGIQAEFTGEAESAPPTQGLSDIGMCRQAVEIAEYSLIYARLQHASAIVSSHLLIQLLRVRFWKSVRRQQLGLPVGKV